MKYFVYALKSLGRNYIYVGLTNDVDRRFDEHNKGYNKTTKPYRPFQIILREECPSRQAARTREKELKSSKGKRFLYNLIESE